VTPLDDLRSLRPGSGQVGLVWLGQAGFALHSGATTMLIDAFLSDRPDRRIRPPLRADEASGIDVIACTHEHWDHLDAATVSAVAAASPGATVVVPRPLVDFVADLGIDRARIVGAQPGDACSIGDAIIHPVPARHGVEMADAYDFGLEASAGLYRFLGYVVDIGGVRVYHAGDTITYEGMAERLRELAVEVALLPINGRDAERESRNVVGNLHPVEALELAAAAGVDLLIPMHYDMFADNPGYPAHLVDIAQRRFAGLPILLPVHGRSFVITTTRRLPERSA
jgi:L-ascorbate 6-phosphate lactonase